MIVRVCGASRGPSASAKLFVVYMFAEAVHGGKLHSDVSHGQMQKLYLDFYARNNKLIVREIMQLGLLTRSQLYSLLSHHY